MSGADAYRGGHAEYIPPLSGHMAQLYGGPVDGHVMAVSQLMPVWHVPMRPQGLEPIQEFLLHRDHYETAEYALVLSGPNGIPMFNSAGEAKYAYRGMI